MNEVQIAGRLAALEQGSRETNRRLDNLESLTESVHVIATEVRAMREDANDIAGRVSEIERKPARLWETLVTAVISAVIGGLTGFFLRM